MLKQDLTRRIKIVRSLSTTIIGLTIAYLIPHVIGFIIKLQSTDPELTPWKAAMASMPIRIVHICGVAVAIVAAFYAYLLWARRFTQPRDGEVEVGHD